MGVEKPTAHRPPARTAHRCLALATDSQLETLTPQVFTTSGVIVDFFSEGLASAGFVLSAGTLDGDTGASAGLSAMLSETVLGESVMVASQKVEVLGLIAIWVALCCHNGRCEGR